jgi:hypothetical protein
MPKTLLATWETMFREEAERAAKALRKLFDIFGDRPFGQKRLTPRQQYELLEQIMETDEDVRQLAMQYSFDQLMAMAQRREQLARRFGSVGSEGRAQGFPAELPPQGGLG